MFHIIDTEYNIIETFTTEEEALEELRYYNDEYTVISDEALTGE